MTDSKMTDSKHLESSDVKRDEVVDSKNMGPKITTVNWPAAIFLTVSPFLAVGGTFLYIWFFGFHWFDIVLLLIFHYFVGLGITAGYHRYFSHKSHRAGPLLEYVYLVLGGANMQMSVLQSHDGSFSEP